MVVANQPIETAMIQSDQSLVNPASFGAGNFTGVEGLAIAGSQLYAAINSNSDNTGLFVFPLTAPNAPLTPLSTNNEPCQIAIDGEDAFATYQGDGAEAQIVRFSLTSRTSEILAQGSDVGGPNPAVPTGIAVTSTMILLVRRRQWPRDGNAASLAIRSCPDDGARSPLFRRSASSGSPRRARSRSTAFRVALPTAALPRRRRFPMAPAFRASMQRRRAPPT